jgi:hypothetical protein
VLPQVRWISAEALPNNTVQLLIWPFDPTIDRPDLAVPLSESGSGVGQVLAILYVVTQMAHPQVILIDEPQSFLHPGAVRKLLEILRAHPKHQFVIATHSPAALTAADAETTIQVRNTGGVATLQAASMSDAKSARTLLADLGVRLEDVFGFDRVLWVEGKTEELCFPVVLRDVMHERIAGTAIVGLTETGDFETRHGDMAFDVYRRLSQSMSLMPPTVAFVFDRELRSPERANELQRRAGGKAHFLPRRMFENYLLDADAIAAVAVGISGFGGVEAETVQMWLDANRWDAELFKPGRIPNDRSAESWLTNVSGGSVLRRLFAELSDTRVTYDKAKHGLELTEWLAANRPEPLRKLGEFIAGLLSA